MNEVTKIHLGRQAYTIALDAHRELRNYLDAIKQHVSDEEVVSEIELRMAELLAERGITGEKVILPADVSFLKEQLGNPKDFAEDSEAHEDQQPTDSKRLFRDTDHAMLAGVAAGLANYFGVSATIIRLLFIVITFMGGWGILLYLVLWLLVPEAKTPSDRLQMAGKPVTVNSLRDAVERADLKGAAHRANKSLVGPINNVFNAILKVIGVGIIVFGLSMLLGLAGGATYAFLKNGAIFQDSIFPVGVKEHMLLYVVAGIVAILSLFIVLMGMAFYRRNWPIRAWMTGALLGLLFVGLAVSSALAADVVPQVRNRFNANTHTVIRTMKPFSTVDTSRIGNDETVAFETGSTYSVTLHYYGRPDLSTVKTTLSNGTLIIDSSNFNNNRNCQTLCIPNTYGLTVTITAPTTPQFIGPYLDGALPESAPTSVQTSVSQYPSTRRL